MLKKSSPGSKDNSAKNTNPKGSGIPVAVIITGAELKKGVDYVVGAAPRVWCTLGQKIQVKGYEPVDIQFGCTEDVREGDSIVGVSNKVIAHVKKMVKPLIAEAEAAKQKFAKLK